MEHGRAGSSVGPHGAVYRYCECGKGFSGKARETFEERDAHILAMGDQLPEHDDHAV